MKPYNKTNIPLARALRKNMTPWERKLWYDFLRTYPIRFQRQKAIGEYIVDFYCAKAGLAIELDGGGHYNPEQDKKDKIRTAKLEEMNLKVVRISNREIDNNFSGVCEYIDLTVKESLPQSAELTAPSSEGAEERAVRNLPPSVEGGGKNP
ncbi:MAG: endonuclease domain-containing protein [Clostridia bacterium]|nr:endonuclease domain-containing protein [Clostridia bacterium]